MLDLKLTPASPLVMRPPGLPGPPAPPPTPAPRWTVEPTIDGTPSVGATLTVGDGVVEGGTVTARSWRRDGVAIGGATGSGYSPVSADAGAMIDVVLTAGGPGGVAERTTVAVGPVSAAPAAAIRRIVIAGDSITSTSPDQTGDRDGFYSYAWIDAHPQVTTSVRAQASRTVGGPTHGDPAGPDLQGNSLLAHRDDVIAYGPQLLTVMIGANDLGTYGTPAYIQRLIEWAAPIRAAGIRIAWSPPTPYRQSTPRQGTYDAYTARREALLATCRDPAVWSAWADHYIPMGEHPLFMDASKDAQSYGDGVHPSALNAGPTSGQHALKQVFDAAMRSLLDTSRAESTMMFDDAWPQGGGNLSTATQVVRRFIVSGVSHTGLAGGVSVTGAAQVRTGGGSWGSGTGHIYNGDVVDIRLTTSADHATAVSTIVTIGSEARELTFTTVANVAPVAYAHGGTANVVGAGPTHTLAGQPFPAIGRGIVAVSSPNLPVAVTVDGLAATRLGTGASGDSTLSIWAVDVTDVGTKEVVVTYGGYTQQTTLSTGVVTNADPIPTQVDYGAPANQGAPHETGALTVPASGIGIAFFSEYGGAGATPGSVVGGTTPIDELLPPPSNGERIGIVVGSRTTSGAAGFTFGFGTFARAAVVFKAAGS